MLYSDLPEGSKCFAEEWGRAYKISIHRASCGGGGGVCLVLSLLYFSIIFGGWGGCLFLNRSVEVVNLCEESLFHC